jgi:predicted phosphodiesterase
MLIPDSHVQSQNLSRFDALGKAILTEKPDYIIQMGDFLSLSSLSHWDMSKKLQMEGRRYRADIDAGKDAIRRMFAPLKEYQAKWQGQWKLGFDKMYKPEIIWIEGNHERWLRKYVEQNPQLDGHMDVIEDLQLKTSLPISNLKIVPYKEYAEINGVLFTHAPIAANGQPTSGKYALARASDITSMSMVFGHTHRWEALNIHRHGSNELIQLLTCGCFFDAPDDYMEGCAHNYWKGITLLDIWDYGRFDTTQLSLDRLYRAFP